MMLLASKAIPWGEHFEGAIDEAWREIEIQRLDQDLKKVSSVRRARPVCCRRKTTLSPDKYIFRVGLPPEIGGCNE
jgi:hypothetical protein